MLFGPSKNGGKTTLAVSAITGDKTGLVLQYSPGILSVPPMVNPDNVFVQQYDFDADVTNLKSDKWMRTKECAQVMEDIDAIVQGWPKGEITLSGKTIPTPDVVILDDGVLLHDYILAWICFVNGIPDPADWKQWGKRTQLMISNIRRIMKLPCTAIFTTWETADKDTNGKVTERWPDVGGKLDYRAVGLADAGLYCYCEKEGQSVKYKVRTRSNGIIQGCGVRGMYDLPETIDVTIDKKNPTAPWDRIWQFNEH